MVIQVKNSNNHNYYENKAIMPELPEVETVKRGLDAQVLSLTVKAIDLYRTKIRFDIPALLKQDLKGRTLTNIRRRSKYLLLDFIDQKTKRADAVMLIHLGMSGQILTNKDTSLPEKHDHMVIGFDGGMRLSYRDPRRFGVIDYFYRTDEASHKLLKDIGPEPLSNHFNLDDFSDKVLKRHAPIKSILLDQKTVAGLGNIYVLEALYQSSISPLRKGSSLTRKELSLLFIAIKETLERAIKAGGSSLKDYVHTDGSLGYFQHNFKVYGKEGEPCPNCDCILTKTGGIKRIVQSGRSSFYCEKKQK